MSSGFWAARRPGWFAAGLVIALLILTVWLFTEKSGTDTAVILTLTLVFVRFLRAGETRTA